ncbi:mechanosensitive ion channel family protein [Cryomorphaceae bacterium 1068]|nr:mechanosensitive ion channel family protein [Cryomorphaceae bacterium 1068]
MKKLIVCLAVTLAFGWSLNAQDTLSVGEAPASFPVVHEGEVLFEVSAKGNFESTAARASAISIGLEKVILTEDAKFDSFDSFRMGEEMIITYNGEAIFSIFPDDTLGTGLSQEALVKEAVDQIKSHAINRLGVDSIADIVKRIGLLVALILSFFLIVKLLNKAISKGNLWIYKQIQKRIKTLTNPRNRFFTMSRLAELIRLVLRFIKWIFLIILVYALLPLGFSIFPSTEGIARTLMGYVLDPLKSFGSALIDYIPQFIAIVVIILIARGIIRFLHYLSVEIERGSLEINGFYPEWAKPTYNLFKFLVIVFSFVAVFPLIPGSGSDVFKGVSVFIGLLISLGSSSAIGNIIAGLVITYMRPYQIGDRVRIGDAQGDVIEKTLLVTRLRTIKNEDVTIPNASILNGNTYNYTANTTEEGLILNTSVTIGYDVPWRKVHAMLIEAAERTEKLQKDPKPFVLQTSLDDFYVNYQINCYTLEADKASRIYSELYGHIQDVFAENKVEILSPHYRAERDGNGLTLPSKIDETPSGD